MKPLALAAQAVSWTRARLAAELRGIARRVDPADQRKCCGGSCSARKGWTLVTVPQGTHIRIRGTVYRLGRYLPETKLREVEERRPDGTYAGPTYLCLVSHATRPFVVVSLGELESQLREGASGG